jgi:hypothetical protein
VWLKVSFEGGRTILMALGSNRATSFGLGWFGHPQSGRYEGGQTTPVAPRTKVKKKKKKVLALEMAESPPNQMSHPKLNGGGRTTSKDHGSGSATPKTSLGGGS